MGHPHPTVEIPGSWPDLLGELDVLMPDDVSSTLADGLRGATVTHPGHVCATAWVLSRDLRNVLLVEHRVLGWSMPGGHLHPGESSREAALRELIEECGPVAAHAEPVHDRPAFVHTTDFSGTDAGGMPHRHWNIAWAFMLGDGVDTGGDERARWWPCDALPDGPSDMAPGLGRILLSLRP